MVSRTLALPLLFLLAVAGCAKVTPPPSGNGAALPAPAAPEPSELVVKRTITFDDFRLEGGAVLPKATLAYETYGRLAADGRNAILITHGFTSSPHAAGRYTAGDAAPGWWDGLIGPGKAIDTRRYFVVSSNMLGSSYGSTGPASINPATDKPYGPDFPEITLRDIVTAQKRMLDALGVKRLVAVAGPSYGGYQAFQWAVTYPEDMLGIVAVVSAPKGSGGEAAVTSLVEQLSGDANWNGGWYYERGGIAPTMTELRLATLRRYGAAEVLAATVPDPAQREMRLLSMADVWAHEFDPNSLVTLRRASVRFDAERDLAKVRAKVLYVLSRTDKLFPPAIAPGVMDRMAAARIDARYVEIDTEFGHSASGPEWAKWSPALREFLSRLTQ